MMPTTQNRNKTIDLLDTKSLAELAQADQLISALGDAFPPALERRQSPRLKYQMRARLELVDDETGEPAGTESVLHTRDLDPSGTGFITREDFPENTRAVLRLPSPSGAGERRVNCTVRRSKDVGKGWFEGVVEFDTEQPVFSFTRIRPKFSA